MRWAGMLWLACVCGALQAGVPELPRLRVTGVAAGLPSTEINAIQRDRAGYVWIATDDGLARFDGIGMRVWRYAPGDATGLPGNNVQALLVDRHDRVWVAVEERGIHLLGPDRQRFVPLRGTAALEDADVWALAQQGDAVWAGTYERGLFRIDASGAVRQVEASTHPELPSNTVLALAPAPGGALWIATDAGLARWRDGRIEAVRLPGEAPAPLVYSLTMDGGRLWVGAATGVHVREPDGRWSQPSWSPMFERPNAMQALALDPAGGGWIGSQRGLWRWTPGRTPMPMQQGQVGATRSVRALLRQPDGALWTPVPGAGLGYLRSDWRRVGVLTRGNGLQDELYRALAPAADGGVWLGGNGGEVEHLGVDGALTQLSPDVRERLAGSKIVSLVEDREGRLWVGHRTGLLRLGTDGTVDAWTADDGTDAVPPGQVHLLRVAPQDGSLWLSTQGGGIQQRDPASGRVVMQIDAGTAGGLGDASTEALVFHPRGEVWIAGADGLSRLDHARARFRSVPAFKGARVHALAFDGADALWLQRLDGLEHWRREGAIWRNRARIGPAHGVPAVAANGMAIDRHRRVWWSTPRGLFRWDPRQRRLQHVGMDAATGSREFLDQSFALSSNGVLAVGSRDGSVMLVDTAAAEPVRTPPKLQLEGIGLRRNGLWTEHPAAGAPVFAHDEPEFRVSARLLAFDDPASHRYWSRLEGHDPQWVAQGSSGDRVLSGLSPGRYRLRLRAQDAAGVPATEQTLAFSVAPPWWRTVWARLLWVALAVMAVLAAAAGYRMRLKRRHAMQLTEQKRVLAEQASQAKSRFLATLGHEVRTPMTGVLGMSELLLAGPLPPRQRQQAQAIRSAGEHLLRLLNDALDLARIEAGRLELEDAPFALRAVVDEVAGLMAPVAERKGLQFVDALDADAPAWLHGDRTRVQQILLNLIGNAVKFTEHGHVLLEVHALSPQGVRMVVRDSGPGLSPAQVERLFRRFEQADGARTAARHGGSGLGLAISQELAQAMGGSIEVDSVVGRGTCFTVDLPLPTAPAAQQDPPGGSSDEAAAGVPQALAILLVEDDPLVASTLTGMLEALGHRVEHAPHALAAMTELAARPFQVALLDLDLPGMDGVALARLLRAQGHAIPLLAVTARADAEAENACRQAGFDGFLRKPLTAAMLAGALRALGPAAG